MRVRVSMAFDAPERRKPAGRRRTEVRARPRRDRVDTRSPFSCHSPVYFLQRSVAARQTPMPKYYSRRETGRMHWSAAFHCVNEPDGLKSIQAESKVRSASIVLCVFRLN
jgi:hypothetical protein